MKSIEKFCAGLLPILFLITLLLAGGYRPAHADDPELSTAVFYVQ
jgi:hypothetical protein